jgi:PncC family amidohydrolase
LSLSVGESCTGGLLSHQITEVPGSSDYYRGCVVAYHDEVKEQVLGVKHETLATYGAVSDQTVREMAEGARTALTADIGVAVTGVAGPGGGTDEKPVGLAYIAIAASDGVWSEHHVWDSGRSRNKALSADAALDLLHRYLDGQLT